MEREFLISGEPGASSEEEEETDFPQLKEEKRIKPFTPLVVPRDRCHCVYLAFLFLGLITVLPWNIFITAEGYWAHKFRDTNSTHDGDHEYKSELQTLFGSYLSIAAMVPSTFFLLVNTLVSSKISHKIRLVGSLTGMLLMFATTMVFTKVNTDAWQLTFFAVTMATVVLVNSCSAMYSGALMGLACSFPSRFMQASMNGQAVGGVFATLAIIASLTVGLPPEDTSFVYFSVASLTIIFSMITYLSVRRTLYFKYYVQQVRDAEARAELATMLRAQNRNSMCYVFKQIYLQGLGTFITFAGTLSVFPAIAILVVSTNAKDGSFVTNEYFIPVGCFLIFNLADLTGRVVSGVVRLPSVKSPVLTLLMCITRLAIIPMLMMCNVQPRDHFPVSFNSDVAFVLIMLTLGFSNGYLVNLTFLYAPQQVEVEHRQTAGAMMAFFMGAGLTTGALFSNVLVRLL